MTFTVCRKKINNQLEIILETSESHKALKALMDTYKKDNEQIIKNEEDLMIKVQRGKLEIYLLVRKGIEDNRRGLEFVKDHF